MNIDNGFDLLVSIFYGMIILLGGLGPKAQDLVISFHLGEGVTLPRFYIRSL